MIKTLYYYFLVFLLLTISGCAKMPPVSVEENANASERITMPAVFDIKISGNSVYNEGKSVYNVGEIFIDTVIKRLKKLDVYAKDHPTNTRKYVIVAKFETFIPGNSFGRAILGKSSKSYNSYCGVTSTICKLNGNEIGEVLARVYTDSDYGSKSSGIDLFEGLMGIGAWKDTVVTCALKMIDALDFAYIKKERK